MDIGDENSIITVNNISPYYSDMSMMTADEATQNKALELLFKTHKQREKNCQNSKNETRKNNLHFRKWVSPVPIVPIPVRIHYTMHSTFPLPLNFSSKVRKQDGCIIHPVFSLISNLPTSRIIHFVLVSASSAKWSTA